MSETSTLPPGVVAYSAPGEGKRYRWGEALITVKISPDQGHFTHMSVWHVELPAGRQANFYAQRAVDRVYYCMEGRGDVVLNCQRHAVAEGSFVYVGRGVSLQIAAADGADLMLAASSIPIAAEARSDVFSASNPAAQVLDVPLQRELLGVLDEQARASFPSEYLGPAYVMGPDEGDSFWQADPTPGYVSCKTSPHRNKVYTFSSVDQLLMPGAYVREHGHQRTCEILIPVKGTGRVTIDGAEELDFSAGAAVLLGPRALHTFRNTGDDGYVVWGVSSPNDIDEGLRATGVKRVIGEPRPNNIVRNPETGRLLVERYGFIIPSNQSDSAPRAKVDAAEV